MKQWVKKKKKEIIKDLNDNLDEIIDKSKSFEEQIGSLKKKRENLKSWQIKIIWRANRIVKKKREDLKSYWPYKDYDDTELKSKYFKIELTGMSNDIDENLFKQIFGHTLIKLADKLINTTNKEENQIIVKNIEKNKDKISNKKRVIGWSNQVIDVLIYFTLLGLFSTLMKQFN